MRLAHSFGCRPILRVRPSPGYPIFRAIRCLGCSAIVVLFAIACRHITDPKIVAIRTDSIRASMLRATRYIDSARNLLTVKDPGGDSEHVASAILLHTPLGDSLQSAVRALIIVCHDNWPNPATVINIDNAFRFTKQLIAPGAWDHLYFADTPTAMAYTFLNSMEDECKSAVNSAISGIDGHPQ